MVQQSDEPDSVAAQRLIRCTPIFICADDFNLTGMAHSASVTFAWMGQEGGLVVDGLSHEVRHQIGCGIWTLECAGVQVASAQKCTVFDRDFRIKCPMGDLTLDATSQTGRVFRIARFGEVLALIAPVHPFTRRATIQVFRPESDFLSLSFAFWVAALMWRRRSQQGGG